MRRTIHIIGAGLSGLAAAVRLSAQGNRVCVHEATTFAGGRCRSYHDAAVGMVIDNGNHLLLSGNHAALAYVREIGAAARLVAPSEAAFDFVDLKSGARWKLRMNDGPLPWWIFASKRRVPATTALDYLKLAGLLFPAAGKPLAEVIACSGTLYERLVGPLLLAALNIAPPLGSAKLASAVIRETLLLGGSACRPLIAREGLGSTLVEPALAYLAQRGAEVSLGHQLHALGFANDAVTSLDFGRDSVALGPDDAVILAVPPYAATALVPELSAPSEFRAIVNAHFGVAPAANQPPILGVINATTEWIFAFPGRVSTTISAGDRLIDAPREELARTIWEEVKAATGLSGTLPPWQIVRERRATFAATPAQDAQRPGPKTRWRNLWLAGDWIDTGLPATIEGAIRSGNRAADLVAS